MFHFPAFPPTTLCIQVAVTAHDCGWVSPFGHPGITARLTAPPGLSRPPTSFIGSWCQGIHHLPYITSTTQKTRPQETAFQENKMLASTMHISTNNQPPPTHRHLTSTDAGLPEERDRLKTRNTLHVLVFSEFNRVCRPHEVWDRVCQPHSPRSTPLRVVQEVRAVAGVCLSVSPPCEPLATTGSRVAQGPGCLSTAGCSLERR